MSSFAIAPGRLMKQPEFVAFRDHLLQQCISIHSERAAKYATPGNAFADLRASEEGGVTAPQAAYIHLGKHYRAVGCIVAQMACGEAPTDARAHRCNPPAGPLRSEEPAAPGSRPTRSLTQWSRAAGCTRACWHFP